MKNFGKKKPVKKNDNKVYIGSGWNKTVKTSTGSFETVSISLKGNSEKDDVMVYLYNKTTEENIPLFGKDVYVNLMVCKEKKTPKSPDYYIQVTLPSSREAAEEADDSEE